MIVVQIDSVTIGIAIFFPVHTVSGVVQASRHKSVGGGSKDFQIYALGSYSLFLDDFLEVSELDSFWKCLRWILEIGIVTGCMMNLYPICSGLTLA